MSRIKNFLRYSRESSDSVLTRTVTLTDAQIKTLPTRVAIIPAPGAGKVLLPLSTALYFDWTANYTNIAGTAKLRLEYDSQTDASCRLDQATWSAVTGLLSSSEDTVAFLPALVEGEAGGSNTGPWNLAADLVNQGLVIYLFNAGAGALTGGNAANTLKVTVLYTVVSV